MKTYTEEDLRKAFRAGIGYGLVDSYYSPTLDEDEYIESLKEEVAVDVLIPFSYGFLRRKMEWGIFCELTGVGYYALREGYEIKDSELFEISELNAKKYNLI